MPLRSVQITLVNNTPFTLTEYRAGLCHGGWSGVPPSTVAPNSQVQWQSQDEKVLTGTEGFVKYTCPQTVAPAIGNASFTTSELVYIYWDNPYVWSKSTSPIVMQTKISNLSAPCGGDVSWPTGDIRPGNSTVTQIFGVTSGGSGPVGWIWGTGPVGIGFTIFLSWPLVWIPIVEQDIKDLETDVNLEFTLGLRLNGSVRGSIQHIYDGSSGLRALAVQAQQPSLRKLFNL